MTDIDNLTLEDKQDILSKIIKERERNRMNYLKRVEQGIKYSKKKLMMKTLNPKCVKKQIRVNL